MKISLSLLLSLSLAAVAHADDDLAPLSDEFDDSATLSDWLRNDYTEGWSSDKLESWDIDTSREGHMRMMPLASSWYQDYTGVLTFKEITGDFVITTRLNVARRHGQAGRPQSLYSLAGIMIRTPRGISNAAPSPDPGPDVVLPWPPPGAGQPGHYTTEWQPDTENYIFLSYGYANNSVSSDANQWQYEVKTTVNGNSTLYPRAAGVPVGEGNATLQIVRRGQTFLLLRRHGDDGPWIVENRYERPDMPETLQVGITTYTDWSTVSAQDPFHHNRTANPGGNPDVVADLDYIRFRRPDDEVTGAMLQAAPVTGPAGSPAFLADTDLAELLGDAAGEPWSPPADDPETAVVPDQESPELSAAPFLWENDFSAHYEGLLVSADDDVTIAGCVERLLVSRVRPDSGRGGLATGVLRVGGRRLTFRGRFDEAGSLQITRGFRNGDELNIELQLMRSDDSDQFEMVRGEIGWRGDIFNARLYPAGFHPRREPVPDSISGRYTMLLPSDPEWNVSDPLGEGWATLVIQRSGWVRLRGVLGDGTRFAEAARLSAELAFAIYRENRAGTVIGGRLTYRNLPDVSDFDGLIQWRRPAESGDQLLHGWAIGSRLVVPVGEEMWLAGAVENIELGAELVAVDWRSRNRIHDVDTDRVILRVIPRTGQFVGLYRDLDSGTLIRLSGAIFQKQNLAGGLGLQSGQAVPWWILP